MSEWKQKVGVGAGSGPKTRLAIENHGGLTLIEAIALLTLLAAAASTSKAPSLPHRDILWGDLPCQIREDGFILHDLFELHDLSPLEEIPMKTRVRVSAVPMDWFWAKALRRNFEGLDDKTGRPVDLDAETHWDERGPALVMEMVQLIGTYHPTQRDNPQAILDAWLNSPTRFSQWEKSPADRSWKDASGMQHYSSAYLTTEAAKLIGFRPDTKGELKGRMAVPPVFIDSRDDNPFVDGRHRAFAARILGLSHIPVVDLAQVASEVHNG